MKIKEENRENALKNSFFYTSRSKRKDKYKFEQCQKQNIAVETLQVISWLNHAKFVFIVDL